MNRSRQSALVSESKVTTFAVPMQPEAAVYISCGTWGLVGVEVEHPVLTPAALAANFTNEGGVDGRVRLLHNVMGLWILSETVRGWECMGAPVALTALLDAAATVPPASVPLFDVNDPRFLSPGDMPARIDTWCAEHDQVAPRTRAEYARSIVESLAQAFAEAAACSPGPSRRPRSATCSCRRGPPASCRARSKSCARSWRARTDCAGTHRRHDRRSPCRLCEA